MATISSFHDNKRVATIDKDEFDFYVVRAEVIGRKNPVKTEIDLRSYKWMTPEQKAAITVKKMQRQMRVAARLVEIRHNLGYSQKDMAIRLGISNSYLGHIERGTFVPSDHIIVLYSEISGKSIDWLLNGDKKEPTDVPEYAQLYRGASLMRATDVAKLYVSSKLDTLEFANKIVQAIRAIDDLLLDESLEEVFA